MDLKDFGTLDFLFVCNFVDSHDILRGLTNNKYSIFTQYFRFPEFLSLKSKIIILIYLLFKF